MELKKAFGITFRKARMAAGISQEHFGLVSSRTYVSRLERGLSSVTLEKLDELANVIDLHPASLVVHTYLTQNKISRKNLIDKIIDDLNKINSQVTN